RGADLQDVAAQLGHADLRMSNRYAHLSPAHLLAAVKKADGVFAGVNDFFSTAPTKTGHDEVTMEHENNTKLLQTAASLKVPTKPRNDSVFPSVCEVQQTVTNTLESPSVSDQHYAARSATLFTPLCRAQIAQQ